MKSRAAFGAVAILAGLVVATPTYASTITFNTPIGATTAGGAVSAQADFTLGNGSINVVLTNLLQTSANMADTILISSLIFNVSGASGSGALTTTNSGLITNISDPSGTYSAGVADPLTRWTATESGTKITLTTLSGGQPDRQIIGPDSAGGFTGAGTYTVNNSVITHLPVVLGSATFYMTVPGVTTSSTLSNVIFEFGTAAGRNQVTGGSGGGGGGGENAPVPEPASMLLLGTGLLGLAAARRRRLVKR